MQTSQDMAFGDVAALLAASLEVRHGDWNLTHQMDLLAAWGSAGVGAAGVASHANRFTPPLPTRSPLLTCSPLPQRCELFTCDMEAVKRRIPDMTTSTMLLPPVMGVLEEPPTDGEAGHGTSDVESGPRGGGGGDAAMAEAGPTGAAVSRKGSGASDDFSAGEEGVGWWVRRWGRTVASPPAQEPPSLLAALVFPISAGQRPGTYLRIQNLVANVPADEDDDDDEEYSGVRRRSTDRRGASSSAAGRQRRKGAGNPGEGCRPTYSPTYPIG